MLKIKKDVMFFKFSAYGFLKNLRFFEPFILLIFRSYGLTFLQIGILYSIRDIATNLLEIPTGIAADAFGRRRAMVSAFVSYLLSFIMLYFLEDYLYLILAIILFAFGEAFRSGTHKALILEYLNIHQLSDLKVHYYGLTRSASQLGSALNALIAAALVFYTGSYRIMFLAAVIPYLLDLINVASYPEELDGDIPGVKREEIWMRLRATLEGFIKIFREGEVIRVLLNSAGFGAFFKSTKDYLQPILAAMALSLVIFENYQGAQREALIIGSTYFGIYLLTSLASRRSYYFSSHFSSLSRAVNITYLAGVILLILSGVSSSLHINVLAVICFILLFILNNIRRPINVGLISDQISSNIMASGLSAEAMVTTILSAVIPPLLRYMVDNLGVGQGISIIGVVMLSLFFFVRVK
ncbi:MAG: MFS transporter [Anaerolineales bacterium]